MSNATQTRQPNRQAAAAPAANAAPAAGRDPTAPPGFDGERWLNEQLDKTVEYRPFMQEDTIKLSARLVLKYLCKPTKSGKVCTEEQAMRFVMLCKARQLNPWEGDAYLVGYDANDGPEFSLITAHQAFLKRAEAHPQYDGMESGIVAEREGKIVEYDGDILEPGDKIVGGWAKVYRKDRGRPIYRRLAFNVFNKNYSRWKVDPAGMIVKCAEADALRSSFPNNLAGMSMLGEPGETSAAPRATGSEKLLSRIMDAPAVPSPVKTALGDQPQRSEPPREPGIDPEDGEVANESGSMTDWGGADDPARR